MMCVLRTILVDDERPALKILARFLKEYPNIEIVGAYTDFSEALEQIGAHDIQLVFLDIDMPNLNGIEAARKIAAINDNTDIVFITAYDEFALAAFEMNTLDYIMKPVTKKRLDKTFERIQKKHAPPDALILRQQRNEFLNGLIAGGSIEPDNVMHQAMLLGIDLDRPFSLFFLHVAAAERAIGQAVAADRQVTVSAIVERLSAEADLLVWETESGVGVLDYTAQSGDDVRKKELARASRLRETIARDFPEITTAIGIAEHHAGAANLADRYVQARNAVAIGLHVSPESGVYHFLDSGFLTVVDRYIDRRRVAALIDRTIGRIIEYDRENGTELFRTMEEIILHDSLQSVAKKMFVHYKTVLFRKQSIERILGISMGSFEGRTTLGLALALHYIDHFASTRSAKTP